MPLEMLTLCYSEPHWSRFAGADGRSKEGNKIVSPGFPKALFCKEQFDYCAERSEARVLRTVSINPSFTLAGKTPKKYSSEAKARKPSKSHQMIKWKED